MFFNEIYCVRLSSESLVFIRLSRHGGFHRDGCLSIFKFSLVKSNVLKSFGIFPELMERLSRCLLSQFSTTFQTQWISFCESRRRNYRRDDSVVQRCSPVYISSSQTLLKTRVYDRSSVRLSMTLKFYHHPQLL